VKVKIGATPAVVLPPLPVVFQVGGRRRIGMLLVEALHGIPDGIAVRSISVPIVHELLF
jgi:hypothetical protein